MTITKPQGRGTGSQPPSSQPLEVQLGSVLACQTFIFFFKLRRSRSTLRWDFPTLKKISCQRCSIIFCLVQGFERRPNSNRFNLVVAIAIAQITFLAGIDATEVKVS